MISAKTYNNPKDIRQQAIELEADRILDALGTPDIKTEKEGRPKDSLSAPTVPTCLRQLSPYEVNAALNAQIPERWKKRISGVVWK